MSTWLPVLLPLTVLALAVLALFAALGRKRKKALNHTFICPATGQVAELVVLHDAKTDRAERVLRCSELPEEQRVTCHEGCVRDMNIIQGAHLVSTLDRH